VACVPHMGIAAQIGDAASCVRAGAHVAAARAMLLLSVNGQCTCCGCARCVPRRHCACATFVLPCHCTRKLRRSTSECLAAASAIAKVLIMCGGRCCAAQTPLHQRRHHHSSHGDGHKRRVVRCCARGAGGRTHNAASLPRSTRSARQ
jgi:hypothetical protein